MIKDGELKKWKELNCSNTVNSVRDGELCCITKSGVIVHGDGCSESYPYYNLEE